MIEFGKVAHQQFLAAGKNYGITCAYCFRNSFPLKFKSRHFYVYIQIPISDIYFDLTLYYKTIRLIVNHHDPATLSK